jgi:molybdenum cofactor guanylyltransferase
MSVRDRRQRLSEPVGAVLAGGLGRRLGGSKATVRLSGRPLICYALDALGGALQEVVVVAKADTELPSLPGVTVWIEPTAPRHPVVGILQALGMADGRRVLTCPLGLPFVTSGLVRELAGADPGGAPAVIAGVGGVQLPLLGCYEPAAAELLGPAGTGVRVGDAVAAIAPRVIEVAAPEQLFSVDAPEDLLGAAAILDRRRAYPNVKS